MLGGIYAGLYTPTEAGAEASAGSEIPEAVAVPTETDTVPTPSDS